MEVNNTFISIIPKIKKLATFNDFRTIDLYNTMYKIFTKIMAIRLQSIMPNLISE